MSSVAIDEDTQNTVPDGAYPLSEVAGGQQEIEGFEMDRYPVTVRRYQAFVNAGGYGKEELWNDAGWHWRVVNDIEAPRFWPGTDPEWEVFAEPGRPVVGVSWFECMAYCRWADRSLPTEAQWEAAARGFDGLAYPWGDDWEDGRIGNRGIGPRTTWPIGHWPQSVGPFGHHDLTGNVWQWTATLEDDCVATKGGSWASRNEQCSNTHRNLYTKEGRWSHVGFRTVVPA